MIIIRSSSYRSLRTPRLTVIASQCLHWRGDLPDRSVQSIPRCHWEEAVGCGDLSVTARNIYKFDFYSIYNCAIIP